MISFSQISLPVETLQAMAAAQRQPSCGGRPQERAAALVLVVAATSAAVLMWFLA